MWETNFKSHLKKTNRCGLKLFIVELNINSFQLIIFEENP